MLVEELEAAIPPKECLPEELEAAVKAGTKAVLLERPTLVEAEAGLGRIHSMDIQGVVVVLGLF